MSARPGKPAGHHPTISLPGSRNAGIEAAATGGQVLAAMRDGAAAAILYLALWLTASYHRPTGAIRIVPRRKGRD